jgi:L-threonylcarbamoyladenylate synthase
VIVAEGDAAARLRAGEAVGIPTDTVYGLAADPSSAGGTDRLFQLKGRPPAVALPVLVGDAEAAARLGSLDERACRLVERYWPGPLTLVVPRQLGVAFDLGGDPSTVGLRCPAHPVALSLLRLTGPLAVTSANLHREPPCVRPGEVAAAFGESLAIVDGGTCDGVPSTVVALGNDSLACLRQGAIPIAEIEELLSAC